MSEECADNVMQLPQSEGFQEIEGDSKVIESKTICYCSNFDLNVNEWFNEFENIEIFKLNMKKNLGKSLALVVLFTFTFLKSKYQNFKGDSEYSRSLYDHDKSSRVMLVSSSSK